MLALLHNLQRLDLPSLVLSDDAFTSLRDLLPGLRSLTVGELCLSSSHADVDCSWRELRLASCSRECATTPSYAPTVQQLTKLPLAQAGKPTPGLQRLALTGIDCRCITDADVAAVRSSCCRLAAVEGKERRPLMLRCYRPQHLDRVLPLLACFEPHAIRSLEWTMDVFGMITQPSLAALGAALSAEGGNAAVASCHTLTLDCHGFQDDAACAALLPMLMKTPITTVHLRCGYVLQHLAAICCPGSLAAVTRCINLQVFCAPVDVQQAQAAVAAAGKAHLICLRV
jgi:hypothetical protein